MESVVPNTKTSFESGDQSMSPAEPDQHWAEELEKRRAQHAEAVEYHQRELERHQRMGRAAHAALAELSEKGDSSEKRPSRL